MGRYEDNELQHPVECERFCGLLKAYGVRRYLEIGSRFGGSLWAVGNALDKGALLVAVDHKPTKELMECIIRLRDLGQRALLVHGDSTDPAVVAHVRKHAPFDAVFVDGRHETYYVAQDWKNYGPMAPIVAFHDIASHATPQKPWKGDCRVFYEKLCETHENVRIKVSGGIGFGIIFKERATV